MTPWPAQALEVHQMVPVQPSVTTADSSVTVVNSAEESYLTCAYENTLRQLAEHARYPDLLFGPLAENATPLYSRHRAESGLIARVMHHNTLLPEQQRQLAEFRFHQYVLWHWYDTKTVISHQIQTDPAFASLPPTTSHACIGTADGQILAYFAIQRAQDRTDRSLLQRVVQAYVPRKYRLGQLDRPLFPAEWESFGSSVFASLPALHQTPIDEVGELNCLLRNQAVSLGAVSIAVAETIYTISQLLLLPPLHLRVLLGCINQQARTAIAKLGMPVLYASSAPVTQNNLPYYWSDNMNESGKFWPFVVSTDDFLANPQHVHHLDEILALAPREIGHGLLEMNRLGQRIVPRAARPDVSVVPYCWADNPFESESAPAATAHNTVSPKRLFSTSRPLVRPLEVSGVTHAAHTLTNSNTEMVQ